MKRGRYLSSLGVDIEYKTLQKIQTPVCPVGPMRPETSSLHIFTEETVP